MPLKRTTVLLRLFSISLIIVLRPRGGTHQAFGGGVALLWMCLKTWSTFSLMRRCSSFHSLNLRLNWRQRSEMAAYVDEVASLPCGFQCSVDVRRHLDVRTLQRRHQGRQKVQHLTPLTSKSPVYEDEI